MISFIKRSVTLGLVLSLTAPALAATQLTGAGATFPYPFLSKAFYQYSQMHPDVTVNYQSIGSGGGIAQLIAKTVDFGASDVPMNAGELQKAGAPILQLPETLGGETITYNVPGIHSGLRLTRQLVVDIFLGKITNWNDGRISALNKFYKMPNLPIIVAHRSDGSGTTYIFTDFLSSVSGEWKSKVGTAKSVQWPAPSSVGSKGNEGVAGIVRNTPGAIGYVELAYAVENHIDTAALQNRSGKWVNCSKETVAAAAATKPTISPTDFSIVDRPGDRAYPISGYSWIMVYEKPADSARGKLVKEVLTWLVGAQAQGIAGSLNYVPLPANIRGTALRALSRMSV